MSKRLWIVVGIVALVAFPIMLALPWLNSLGQQWVTCDVTDASPSKGTRFSPSLWRVLIETRDCGPILYTQGVTEDNVEDLAESIEPGPQDLRLSWLSRQATNEWNPMTPTAQEIRELHSREVSN